MMRLKPPRKVSSSSIRRIGSNVQLSLRTFFKDIADQVRPGNRFESIIRSAVACGMFPDAEADPEGWLAAVLERRRHSAGRAKPVSQTASTFRSVITS